MTSTVELKCAHVADVAARACAAARERGSTGTDLARLTQIKMAAEAGIEYGTGFMSLTFEDVDLLHYTLNPPRP